MEKGVSLPAMKTEIFSTATDNQTHILIHPLVGESLVASENHSLGWWRIQDIPPMPRGVPNISVEFLLDQEEELNLKAIHVETGNQLPITHHEERPQWPANKAL